MAGSPKTSSLADPALLETIDKLFELNIGEYVALPQLLVVGDQSSGKSSVLEGLTGIPYPRNSSLCTRYATQITFRRAPTARVSVSVIPAVDAQPEYAEKLRKWKKDDLNLLDSGKFASVLTEVNQLMGLAESPSELPDGAGEARKTFANDVFKIEICGPDQEHLSVIDVPAMVTSYMENPRSALLAVIPANVDIGTQEILEMAEICDPKGQRTLGVLTKPDLVDKGAEQDVIKIIEGKSHPLNLGWCIVRNSGQQHLNDSAGDRHGREKVFFSKEEPWNKVTKDRVGIEALKLRLVYVLAELIRREFPNVRLDINKRLKICKQNLDTLGPCRETKDQQYKYLLDIACRYQEVTSKALKAGYGDDLFDNSPGLKLANSVVLRNENSSIDVSDQGHTYDFKDNRSAAEAPFATPTPTEDEELVCVRYEKSYPELDDLMEDDCDIVRPKKNGIKPWLEEIYKSSRGFELGTFDVSLLTVVWRKQSANWDALAMGYINDVVSLVHTYTIDVLSTICADKRIRRGVSSVLLDLLTARYKKGIDHAKMILVVEREGTPLTANHYFAENLEKCRQSRVKSQMEKHQFHHASVGWYVKTDAIIRGTTTSSNLEHTICDIHDILKSYYKVARKRFVDNVMMQAAAFHLVTGPDSPIKVFTPGFVSDLTTEQLEAIAGEDANTKRKRAELKREIESLEKGKKML